MKPEESDDVVRRLRANIYRMARKSAYLPHALQIGQPSISNRRNLGAGAHAMVTKAVMNGRDVAIKEIVCSDRAAQRKCLEVWNFLNESLSLQTKIWTARCSPARLSCGKPYDTRILFHSWESSRKALSTWVWCRRSSEMVTSEIT